MKRTGKKGFTLVELMVVAVIVAILAAVAIPLMTGQKKRAMATEAESALGTIRTCLRAMYADTGAYNRDPNGKAITPGAATQVPGVDVADLSGRYFHGSQYEIESIAADSFVLKVTGTGDVSGVTITLNEKGTFVRSGL